MMTYTKTLYSIVLLMLIVVSSCKENDAISHNKELSVPKTKKSDKYQIINLFVTHGHCSTPFSGKLSKLKFNAPSRVDQGNPLENLTLSFEIDPNSFNVCANDDLTMAIKTPGLFISDENENITFESSNIYTMGIDWYQINGKMTIKGVENDVKFFASGIRDSNKSNSDILSIEGQVNLLDWGIDYDKIVNGESDPVPTKWMHLNLKIEL